MNKMNLSTALCIFAVSMLAIAFAAVLVSADPNAPVGLTPVGSSSRNLSTMPAASANAQGGNVTEININSITITRSWQGYYGNVTGQVALIDANNQTFYNWSLTTTSGRVFATRTNQVNWTGVNCLSAANRSSEETYLGKAITDSDSVMNTYNKTTHPSFAVGAVTISQDSCYSTNGYVSNNSQSSSYVMVLLGHSGGQVIYTTITNKSTVGFDGKQHDFELLVGENEKTGSIGVTPYYFWTEFT